MNTLMALLAAPKYVLVRYTCRGTAHTPTKRIHSTTMTGPQHKQNPSETVNSNLASLISSRLVPCPLSVETRNLRCLTARNTLWYRMITAAMGTGMFIVRVVVKRIIKAGVNEGEL